MPNDYVTGTETARISFYNVYIQKNM